MFDDLGDSLWTESANPPGNPMLGASLSSFGVQTRNTSVIGEQHTELPSEGLPSAARNEVELGVMKPRLGASVGDFSELYTETHSTTIFHLAGGVDGYSGEDINAGINAELQPEPTTSN